jgi:hypothetical protein
MPSTLTARGEDGKQSKKIERNTRDDVFIEILLLSIASILGLFAQGLSDAQSRVAAPYLVGGAILKASTGKRESVMNESDWKLYCVLRPLAHERMCVRIMADVEKVVLDKSVTPYERIDTSEEMLKAGQKELYWAFGVFRFSRHEARSHLLGLCARELITAEELTGFSAETQEWIAHCLADREVHGIEDLDAE